MREVGGLRVAEWLVEENAHPARTRRWIIPRRIPRQDQAPIEGYLDRASVLAGEPLSLHVNTAAPTFRVFVYRIGYYGGFGGRLIAQSPELAGVVQPAPRVTPGTNLVECAWTPSWQVTVGEHWPPGNYLMRLEGARDEQRYVPFVVRDDESRAAYLVQSSVTTWQAYNPYGGYSLYGGPGKESLANRARIVSFDRPYGNSPSALDGHGSGDFLGNELPFVFLAERLGLDVSYWTDLDLHSHPELLANHRCLVSLGHDEYWSTTMRDAVEERIRKGLNVAFLGANACYRQIRLASSASGAADRQMICYKDASEDPITASDPALSTGVSWATDPIPRPESSLIGVMYQSYGGSGPLVVADASSWVFDKSGLADEDRVPEVIGSEFDGFEPLVAQPPGEVEILAHSPTGSVTGKGFSDMTYYAAPGGGGVFASGTASWVSALWQAPRATVNKLGFGPREAAAPLTRVTLNVLGAFGEGPAALRHPSRANWRRFYAPDAATRQAVDVP